MSRRDEFKKENPNPATKFLEWKGEKQAFQYYDKEAEENKLLELPVKFLVMKEMHTVKGWSNASESGIYSNEVTYIGKEQLHVRSFKGGDIAKGFWKDIKSRVDDFGGYYAKSIYVMLESGDLVNISLKGGAVSEWYDFTKKTKSRLGDEWIEVREVEERKNGAVKYNVPVFKFNTSITDSEDQKAEAVYETLKLYMDSYTSANEIETTKEEASINESDKFEPVKDGTGEPYAEDDDLPF